MDAGGRRKGLRSPSISFPLMNAQRSRRHHVALTHHLRETLNISADRYLAHWAISAAVREHNSTVHPMKPTGSHSCLAPVFVVFGAALLASSVFPLIVRWRRGIPPLQDHEDTESIISRYSASGSTLLESNGC